MPTSRDNLNHLLTLAHPAVKCRLLTCRWHVNEHCGGSAAEFLRGLAAGGASYLAACHPAPSWASLRYIAAFGAVQASLQLFLPGRRFEGPPTPKGNVPVYTANGVQAYAATLALFFGAWRAGLFDPGAVYDHLGSIVSTSNLLSLALCAALYLKGTYAPSSTDAGSTGSRLFDFYW